MTRRQSPTRRHSPRARKNTRLGIELRIKTIEVRIKELREEVKLFRRYKKMGLNHKFLNRVIWSTNSKIATRKMALKEYKDRHSRLKREGKI